MKLNKAVGLLVLPIYLYGCLNYPDKVYYPNGKIKSIIEISHGKRNGLYQTYYENGQLAEVGQFIDNVRYGKHLLYYETGKLRAQFFLKNDTLNGVRRLYFPNGNIQEDFLYVNGKTTGVGIQYYPNGQVNSIYNYKDDRRNGEGWTFSTQGKITYYYIYQNDSLLYYKQYDSLSGKPMHEFRNVFIECNDTFKEGEHFEAKIKFFGPLDQNNEISKTALPLARIISREEPSADYIFFANDTCSYSSTKSLKAGGHFFEIIICMDVDTAHNEVFGRKKFIVLPNTSILGPFKNHKSFIGFDAGKDIKWIPTANKS